MNPHEGVEDSTDLIDELSFPSIGRATPELIYETLRAQILSAEKEPGSTLAQSIVARSYGVSRGPVREAFRMLQREGLIESETNFRATVTPLSIEEVEHLYAMRIVNECMALSVSIPQLSPSELDELDALVVRLNRMQVLEIAEWETCHQRFHGLLFAHVSDRTRSELAHWAEHTERYRRVYIQGGATGWALGATEHAQIALACRNSDAAAGTRILAQHLARAGLTLVAIMDPSHKPDLLRAALNQVTIESR